MGIADADSAEHDSGSKNIVITPVSCEIPNPGPDTPRLSGGGTIHIEPGTQLYAICGRQEIREEFFCNYEVNASFETGFIAAGLRVSGRGEQSEARAVELPGNRFFLAMLYQPQLSSTPERPHPVITAFLEAAAGFSEVRPAGRSTTAP
jgi:CTP synthase (UTP-ammonia lyase)